MSWSDEARAWVLAQFKNGYSAGQISARLKVKFPDHPRKSRNAVIGVTNRAGLTRDSRSPSATKKAASRTREISRSVAARRWNAVTSHDPDKVGKPDPEVLKLLAAPPPEEAPEPLRLTIHVRDDRGRLCENPRLTSVCCRWPLEDPLNGGFHFCGHETVRGAPYCPFHFGRAFGKPSAVGRRAVAAARVAEVAGGSNPPASGQSRETEDA